MEIAHLPLPVDGARYTVQDGVGTLRSAVPRWRWVLEGLDHLPGGAEVALSALGDALEAAGGHGTTVAQLVDGPAGRLTELATAVGPTTGLTEALDRHHPLVTAVESVDRLLSLTARAVLATGAVGPVAGGPPGSVVQVSAGPGGVPKPAVSGARLAPDGLVGDRQADRRHHGRPSQAVCLWSAEVIDDLRAEGHHVTPGAAGENLTVAGLDWAELRAGVRLAIGERVDGAAGGATGGAAVVELTGWTEPCSKLAHLFVDSTFRRIDHDRHPGWARAYAAVVRGGELRPGDRVTVVP